MTKEPSAKNNTKGTFSKEKFTPEEERELTAFAQASVESLNQAATEEETT